MAHVKRLMMLALVVVLFGTTLLQTAVSIPATATKALAAGTEDVGSGEDKELEKDIENDLSAKGSENIFNNVGTDTVRRGRVLGSMKYNEQMQYLMTYTILKGKYMQGKYAAMYNTGESEAGAVSEGINIGIKYGYSNIVLEAGEDNDSTHDKDTSKDDKKEADKKKRDEAVEEVTKLLAKQFSELYILKYYMSDSEMTNLLGTGVTVAVRRNSPATETEVKKYLDEFTSDEKGKKGNYYLIYKKIEDYVRKSVESNKALDLVSAGQKDFLDQDIAKDYVNANSEFKAKPVKVFGKELYLFISKPKDKTIEEVRDVARFFPYRADSTMLQDAEKNWNYTKEFADTYTEWLKKKEKWFKGTKEYTNYAKVMKSYDEDKTEGETQVKNEGVYGLGWMPLKIKVSEKVQGDKKYKEIIKEFDGGEIKDKGRVTIKKKDGTVVGERPLQINDLFNMPVKKDQKRSTSASPYLSYNYLENYNKGMSGAYIGDYDDYELTDNIGKYSSVKMEKVSNNVAEWMTSIFGANTGKGIANALSDSDIGSTSGERLYPHRGIAAVGTNVKKLDGIENKKNYVLGIDNYGNIISGQTLQVVIPYWMNTEVPEFKNFNTEGSFYYATPLMNGEITEGVEKALNSASANGKAKEASTNISGLGFVSDKTPYQDFLGTISGTEGDIKAFAADVRGGDSKNAQLNTQALALAIVAGTKSQVEAYNKNFVKIADETSELYLQSSSAGFDPVGMTDSELLDKYTSDDLIQRIGMLLDVGFFEIVRLTVASWVVSFYTGDYLNFSMSSVFHTTLITDTAMWGEVVRSISFLLMGIVGIYILFMSVRLFRRTMTILQFIKQFIAVTLVLVIPTVVYSPLVNLAINAPTQKIVGTQMEQMSLLDAYMNREAERREQDPMYSKLFGSVSDLRDRTEDYVVDFYTTQHVDGFDVTKVDYSDLSYKNQFRNIASDKKGKWRKTDLIKVKVSIFDLFEWVEAEENDEPLFSWLVNKYPKKYGEIAGYEEFSTSTAVSYPELGVNEAGEVWKASELYRKMYRDTNDAEVIKNISSLYSITEAFRNRGNDRDSMKITDYEREALVRDLSMTSDSRETLYGDGRQMSKQATDLVLKYGGEKMVGKDGDAIAPKDDFLALADIVNKLVPYRDMTTTTLDRDVYNINKKVIDEYISNYSLVRETVGDKAGYKEAEFHMIVMNMWFSVNDILDLPMFPRTYEVSSISFDSYMRLVFIPMDAFANIEDKDLDNVSQYIALREHPMTLLFLFLPTLLLLVIFGMIYIAMFFGLMMVVLTASFIWHYVIKNNMQNKSWLGALMIIGSFALVKLGLLLIWKAESFILNYTVVANGGITYPYVAIHSIVISVYLVLAFVKVFLRVFKAIWKDKSNLGGEIFSQGISTVVGNVKGMLTGQKPSKSDGNNGAGTSVTKELGKEGEEGKVKPVTGGFSVGALKQLVSDKMGYVNETDEDIKDIQDALNATGELGEGHEFASRFKDSVPGVKGKMVEGLAEDYDSIEGDAIGLSEEERENLESAGSVGSIISTTADGNDITTLDAETAENAELIKSELTKKGIKAVTDGSKVLFNSQGVNLDSQEVRKGLFGGAVKTLLKETDAASKLKEEKVENVKDYETNKDGTVSIGVGDTGISTEGVAAVLESKTFKDSFDVVEMPVIKDGKFLQGTMKVVPKHTGVNVKETMESMYKVDDTMRSIKGVSDRADLNLSRGVTLTEDEQTNRKLSKMMVDGMKMQDGKLLYNDKNEEHVGAAKRIMSEVRKNRDGEQEEKSEAMLRLMSQVTKGGSNGFRMNTVNTSQDAEARAFAQASGLMGDKVETTVFAGKNAKKVTESVNNIRNLINASPKDVEAYMQTRDELYQMGESIMMGKNESPEKVLNEMAKYARKNKVEESQVNSIMDSYEKLGVRRKNSDIKETEYHREVEKLMSGMQITLQDAGKYDQLMTETIRKDSEKGKGKAKEERQQRNTELLDRFTDSKKSLKGQGVDVSTMEKYSEYDFDKLGQMVGDIETVTSNEDGTLNIKSYSKLNNDDMVELFGGLMGDGKKQKAGNA